MSGLTPKGFVEEFSEEMVRILPRRIVGPLDSGGFNQTGKSVG